jgi:hypothetical protein
MSTRQSHGPRLRPHLRAVRWCGAWPNSGASEPAQAMASQASQRSGKAINTSMHSSMPWKPIGGSMLPRNV